MPRLACQKCGRQLYTVTPLDSLSGDERRCPRCGAFLNTERREVPRRTADRRQNPPDDPGPPEANERRIAQRRVAGRRGSVASDAGRLPGRGPDARQ
jgi:ribosomal protein S27AE